MRTVTPAHRPSIRELIRLNCRYGQLVASFKFSSIRTLSRSLLFCVLPGPLQNIDYQGFFAVTISVCRPLYLWIVPVFGYLICADRVGIGVFETREDTICLTGLRSMNDLRPHDVCGQNATLERELDVGGPLLFP